MRSSLLLGPAAYGALLAWSAAGAPDVGVDALLQIFLPHLWCLAIGCALLVGGRVGAAMTAGLLAVGIWRFGPELYSPAGGDGGTTVVTWNVGRREAAPVGDVVDALLDTHAEVVAIQELSGPLAAALAEDPRARAAWPHQELWPDKSAAGLGLLSARPLNSCNRLERPLTQHCVRDDGVELFNAHVYPGKITTVGGWLPVHFDGRVRDEQLRALNAAVTARAEAPVILFGDYNVTPWEPGFAELSAGLVDLHRAAGHGPGWSWRPMSLVGSGFGVLRIDHQLTSPTIRPVSSEVRCMANGDHCMVLGRVLLPT